MKKILFVLFLLLLPTFSIAQELRATVTVNYEQMSLDAKDKLVSFQQEVERYLNNTRFTEQEWEGDPITCSFNIFFLTNTGDINYTAQVVVNSQRPVYRSANNSLMLNVMDKEWGFSYEKSQSMLFNLIEFDPLTSFLNYYAYLIIGLDMDSYNPMGGTDYFNQAYDIAIKGSTSKFKSGWTVENKQYNRRKLLDEIGGANFVTFRRDFFDYHYNGLDIYSQNKAQARKNIVKLVDHLYENMNKIGRGSVYLKVFFDAKAPELVSYMKDSEEKELFFTKLMKINPENLSKYEKGLKDEEG